METVGKVANFLDLRGIWACAVGFALSASVAGRTEHHP